MWRSKRCVKYFRLDKFFSNTIRNSDRYFLNPIQLLRYPLSFTIYKLFHASITYLDDLEQNKYGGNGVMQ